MQNSRQHVNRHCAQPSHGFTLIELLIVVAIISSAALLAFGINGEDRAQQRLTETRLRLSALFHAILGPNQATNGNRIAGYVADNGALPEQLLDLINKPTGYHEWAQLKPIFDPTPDTASCANTGTSSSNEIQASGGLLTKGHRGNYLQNLAYNAVFRDGWGNHSTISDTADAADFGWIRSGGSPTDTTYAYTITSLGTDNISDPAVCATNLDGDPDCRDAYKKAISLALKSSDWRVPIGGWSVTLNKSNISALLSGTGDIPASTATSYSISLLVYVNSASGSNWLRYSTDLQQLCFDRDNDGLVSGASCSPVATFTFPAGCAGAGVGVTSIPQGRHLLVVVNNPSGSLFSSTDTPFPSYLAPILKQVDVVAGQALPAMEIQ